ncbi:MAG: MoaD/ThiS family protein [Flavobacteriales bacterium]
MNIKLLAFGIATEILNGRSIELEVPETMSIGDLRNLLDKQYIRLRELKSYAIARNNIYALDDEIISQTDEIAILPPVSGG